MIIYSLGEGQEMEFEAPENGSGYFREKFGTTEKGTYIELMFPKLDVPRQQLIINLIRDLLTDAKKDALLQIYFQAFLDDYGISYFDLANYITAYLNYSYDNENQDKDIDPTDIASKLQRFLKSNRSDENNVILQLASGYFSVSPDVLITGKGKKYSIDFEFLEKILEKNNMDVDTFLDEHFQMEYIAEVNDEKEENNYKQYIHHNAIVFAQIVEEQFNIASEDILLEDECWVELEEFPIKKYYDNLTDKNKEIVNNVLFYLSIK